jgi:hypothetical protein
MRVAGACALITIGVAGAGLAVAWAAAASAAGPAYRDEDYFRFADRIVSELDRTWDAGRGYYQSGAFGMDSRYNAALLLIHATAAAHGREGGARNDDRARQLADRLTASPPFYTGLAPSWPDRMFHTPGWVGNMVGGYGIMDKAIDPKVAEGLQAAWHARGVLGLPEATAARIAAEISQVAYTSFFRYPNVRLNQINWPAELYFYEALVTGTPELLLSDYRRQMRRFVAGIRRPWGGSPGSNATNLSPTYRFHYQINQPAESRRNLDSAEYANMTLHFLAFYDDALRVGMAPLPRSDVRLLRAWVQRDLFGYWMHSGLLNWDTGLGFKRWMKGKAWAYALQGLLAIADAERFHNDSGFGPWAKAIFDRALDFYVRQEPPGGGVVDSGLFGVDQGGRALRDNRMLAARMGANAVRAVSTGLGARPAADPPPFYAFDPDVGRLAVSTPRYGTAVVAVNRRAFPYGGIELARLHDAQGDPIGGIGGRMPAAFGVQVRDAHGRRALASQRGLARTPARPPLTIRSPDGRVARVPELPARPPAGPFAALEAVGRRRSHDLEITTRHRFSARSIEETWTVRRRAGRRRYTVAVLLPSWGREASIDAELDDGTVVPLAVRGVPGGAVSMRRVRRLRLRGQDGGYTVTPVGAATGRARAISVLPQPSAPAPGPTVEITLRRDSEFRRARLQARITPATG